MWPAVRRTGLVTLVLPACLLLSHAALSATITFRAELKGSNEVPPKQLRGKGTLAATYDTVTKRLTWRGSYSGLSSKVTGFHFHGPANPNREAGVALTIKSLSNGTAILSDLQAADLLGGYWYVDIHTRAHRGGEIRGQVVRGQ